jgi:hypothetical protein
MRVVRWLSVLLLLATTVIAFTAYLNKSGEISDETYPARAYVKIATITRQVNSGPVHLDATSCRWVTKDGEWKEIRTSLAPDGTMRTTTVVSNKEGVYLVEEKTGNWQLVDRPSGSLVNFYSSKFVRQRSNVIGEGTLLGLKTYVSRLDRPGHNTFEKHLSPELGPLPLKTVWSEAGVRIVNEAVNVLFTDVPDSVVTKPPNALVKSDYLRERIQSVEQGGLSAVANSLRQLLEEQK